MENAPLEDDNAFWPRVLMQLSQRMDEVQRLKAEVIHLRREVRDEHDLQARAFVEHAATLISSQRVDAPKGPRCLLANRLLSEQTDVQNLKKQKDVLELERRTVLENQAGVHEANQTIQKLELGLSQMKESSISECQKRDAMIQELTRRLAEAEHDLQATRARNEALTQTLSRSQSDLTKELEAKNRALTEELHKVQEENKSLKAGLHKEKDSIRVALENLQGRFRQLPHSPQALPTTQAPHSPPVRPTDKPPTVSLSVPITVKSEGDNVSFIDLSDTSIQPDDALVIPPSRQSKLNSFPSVVVDDDLSSGVLFSRKLLSEHLGGSCQPLVVKITKSQKALAQRLGITSYLCPNLDLNPWCPTTPGEHGYMFVGLGTEKDTFLKPEVHHLFVGLKKQPKQSTRLLRYLGQYSVSRVDALSAEEWETLPENVKEDYCNKTHQRISNPPPKLKIRTDYDSGKHQVPCVMLRCIDYNNELANTLARKLKVPPSSPRKRRREDNE
ncbi:hypothetical protein ONZ45_g1876 [Pleurotus djamor]|nr:hypothetical protein ONZ45_g1876 [Pleurotus djamor]